MVGLMYACTKIQTSNTILHELAADVTTAGLHLHYIVLVQAI